MDNQIEKRDLSAISFSVKKVPDFKKPSFRLGLRKSLNIFVIAFVLVAGLNFPQASIRAVEILDRDADGVSDSTDNCPNVANSDQADADADGVGSACDNCPNNANADQADADADGVGDVCDNCVMAANSSQMDDDLDAIGNVCDQYDCRSTGAEVCGDSVDNNCDGYVDESGVGQACYVETNPTTFHFIKRVCPAYSNIAGNESSEQKDDTGGNYVQFSNYHEGPSFSPLVPEPIATAEIPESCRAASGWNFQVDDNSGMGTATTLGPTDSSGSVDVVFADLPANVKTSLSSGGQMWVKENTREGYGFGALRCYRDALNGDNLEYVSLGANPDNYPADVYCIAYNVRPETAPTGDLTICKYNDANHNHEKDSEEEPLEWQFTVTHPNQSTSSVSTISESGCVTIPDLPEGEYTVTEADDNLADDSVSWVKSSPASGSRSVDLTSDGARLTFLNYPEENACVNETVTLDEVPAESLASWTVADTGGNPIFSYSETGSPYDDSWAIRTSVVGSTIMQCPSQYLQKTYTVSGNAQTSVLKAYLAFTSSMEYYNFPYVVADLRDSENHSLGYQVFYGKGVIGGLYAGYAAADPAHYTELAFAEGDMTLDLSKIGDVNFSKIVFTIANYACIGENSVIFDHLRLVNACGNDVVVTDPALVKTLDNGNPAPGATITYTLVASNNSSVTSTNITVTDPLPSTVTYVSNDSGAAYDATSTTVTWNIASIAPNSTATLHIVATVKGDATGSVSNTATITSGADQGNSDPENDSSTATGTVKSEGGCTSNCGGGGGGGGGGGYTTPTPQVLGTTTFGPSLQMPEGEVKGAATQLPRTGLPVDAFVLAGLMGLAAVFSRQRR